MSNTPTLNETLKLLTKGGPHHPKLVEAIYDVYGLVDSLQQQMAEKDQTIEQLNVAIEIHKDNVHDWNRTIDKMVVEAAGLRKALEERDRKITWLTNELGE
ncbi:hypothetical protein NLX78_04225 [Paenibacillus sp. Lou8.1]|uniref:hypothetical protein n=1 Tax=Paenibacillus sp. Lou8.1 TaxID=2962041 RepID=UPI0020B8ACDF|nr:hypothetical protein [Paenibacillus sp. Lou8.1]MCP3806432.1 hypothetical protein [Paenibacillus sp. Lou8.1]